MRTPTARAALAAASALAVAAAVAVTGIAAPAPAGAAPHDGTRYTGTEYHQGGTTTPVDGPQPAMDALADGITASTDAVVRDIARERATLRYGRIYPDPHARPQLSTYPAPAGSVASDQYAVTVHQGSRTVDPFTYQVQARKTDTNREKDTSWTSFAFAGPVLVSVRKLDGSATGCLVRPASARIRPVFGHRTCSFVLTSAAKVSVEFAPNETNPVLHPMLVFADPPEVDVPPASGDPDVLYLGPGVHHLGARVPLHSGETVYLAPGAWVEGTFAGTGLSDVVIRGRGVMDGTFLDTGDQAANKGQPGMIDVADSHNVVVDGLTFVNGPRFNVRVLGDHVTLHDLKVMSWWYSTDCVWGGHDSLVEGNFCKVDDDSLKPMLGPSVIRGNTVWQLENGAPFMISWNITTDETDFHVYDNDVIHAEHYWLSPQAVFRSRHATPGHLSRYLFEDIRVEDATWRLFYLILEDNKWHDPVAGYGQVSDLVFRDITATTPFTMPSVISGIDPDHRVYDVDVADVHVDGRCAASAADGNFQIDPATTDGIRIMRSAGCR